MQQGLCRQFCRDAFVKRRTRLFNEIGIALKLHLSYFGEVQFSGNKSSLQRWKSAQQLSGMERETWEGSNRLLQELTIFGWLRFHSTLPGALEADKHPGEFEIHYLKRGRLNWWVDGNNHEFLPGCVFIVQPGQLHGGDEESLQPCEHVWLRLSCEDSPVPGVTEDEFRALREGLAAIQSPTFPVSDQVGEDFWRLLEEHRNQDSSSPLVARSLLHLILTTILRDYALYTQKTQNTPLVSWRIRKALEILSQNWNTPPRISELAQEVGLSESGFRERFKAETSFSPLEYILHQRISAARKQLEETPHDITRIAHDLGFSSSQYFATVFRRLVGLSPGEYRKRHKRY